MLNVRCWMFDVRFSFHLPSLVPRPSSLVLPALTALGIASSLISLTAAGFTSLLSDLAVKQDFSKNVVDPVKISNYYAYMNNIL